jgi:ubiquinone/menaquinone biosynthesis C-methylase UbiE
MQLTELVHQYLDQHLTEGSLAIDATAGNGHDTLKMAKLVGDSGKVIGMDIQFAAIEATSKRLADEALSHRCTLIEGDHASVLAHLISDYTSSAATITFNLGYLPGSDKSIQTHPKQTLRALDAAANLLHPGGVLLVTAYRGHAGGQEEAAAVERWMHEQETKGCHIEAHEPKANRIPPILWACKRTHNTCTNP